MRLVVAVKLARVSRPHRVYPLLRPLGIQLCCPRLTREGWLSAKISIQLLRLAAERVTRLTHSRNRPPSGVAMVLVGVEAAAEEAFPLKQNVCRTEWTVLHMDLQSIRAPASQRRPYHS